MQAPYPPENHQANANVNYSNYPPYNEDPNFHRQVQQPENQYYGESGQDPNTNYGENYNYDNGYNQGYEGFNTNPNAEIPQEKPYYGEYNYKAPEEQNFNPEDQHYGYQGEFQHPGHQGDPQHQEYYNDPNYPKEHHFEKGDQQNYENPAYHNPKNQIYENFEAGGGGAEAPKLDPHQPPNLHPQTQNDKEGYYPHPQQHEGYEYDYTHQPPGFNEENQPNPNEGNYDQEQYDYNNNPPTNKSQYGYGNSVAYHHNHNQGSIKKSSIYGNYSGYEAAVNQNLEEDPKNYVQNQQTYPHNNHSYEMDPNAYGAARKVYPPVSYLNYQSKLYKNDHEPTDPNRPPTPREKSVDPNPEDYYKYDLNLNGLMRMEHMKINLLEEERINEKGEVVGLNTEESSDEEEESEEKQKENINKIIEQFKNRKYRLFNDIRDQNIQSFHKSQLSIFGKGTNDKIKTTLEVYDDKKFREKKNEENKEETQEVKNFKVFDLDVKEPEKEETESVYSELSQNISELNKTADDKEIEEKKSQNKLIMAPGKEEKEDNGEITNEKYEFPQVKKTSSKNEKIEAEMKPSPEKIVNQNPQPNQDYQQPHLNQHLINSQPNQSYQQPPQAVNQQQNQTYQQRPQENQQQNLNYQQQPNQVYQQPQQEIQQQPPNQVYQQPQQEIQQQNQIYQQPPQPQETQQQNQNYNQPNQGFQQPPQVVNPHPSQVFEQAPKEVNQQPNQVFEQPLNQVPQQINNQQPNQVFEQPLNQVPQQINNQPPHQQLDNQLAQQPQPQQNFPLPQNSGEPHHSDAINTQNYLNQQMNNVYPQAEYQDPQQQGMYPPYPQNQIYPNQAPQQFQQYENAQQTQGIGNNFNQEEFKTPQDNNLPMMTEEDRTELLEMYPYMINQSEEVILNFWRNMKQLSERIGNADSLDPKDIKMLEERDKIKFDESRTSEMIKQELRRKRKRKKKKKVRRKETGDYNMIDNISEFSRGTHMELRLHSVVENNRLSRSVSISSKQKSEPDLVFSKSRNFEVKSEGSSKKGSKTDVQPQRGLQSSKKNPPLKQPHNTQDFVSKPSDVQKKIDNFNKQILNTEPLVENTQDNQPNHQIPSNNQGYQGNPNYEGGDPYYYPEKDPNFNQQTDPNFNQQNDPNFNAQNDPYFYYNGYQNQGFGYGHGQPPNGPYPYPEQPQHQESYYYYDQYQNPPPPGNYQNPANPGFPPQQGVYPQNHPGQQPFTPSGPADSQQQSEAKKKLGLEEGVSLLEQCKHKKLTGKLQRKLRDMNDEERLEIFRTLKPDFLEICCDPYGKYVATLFLSFTLPAIHDATVSFFDKNMDKLVKDQYGIKFCQKIVEVKFKDKRVRRTIKRMLKNLQFYILDKYASLCVLSYVNQTTGDDLNKIAEFCKENINKCLENENMAKIISKLIKKVKTGIASELILYLRQVIIQLIRRKKGKELVEVFFDHASPEDRGYVIQFVLNSAEFLIQEKENQYIFYKLVELELVDWINGIIDFLIRDSDQPQRTRLVNQCVSSRNLQILFLKASRDRKGVIRDIVYELKQVNGELSEHGKKLEALVNKYFYS